MTTKKNVAEVNLDCLKGRNGNSCFKQEKQKKQSDPPGNLAGDCIAAMSNLYSLRSVLKSSNLILF